jgi:hypothetical protein
VNSDEQQLWLIDGVGCVMISCCSGAELQLRRGQEIVLRELYPSKSDLYERANDLKTEHRRRRAIARLKPSRYSEPSR